MIPDKLTKLRQLLAQKIEREADVVYILVEVRKVIDLEEGRFSVLKFFCDWILHPRLERRDAKQILKTFDNSLEQALRNPSVALRMMNNVSGLMSLRLFLDDLFIFLGEHRLDTSLVGNLSRLEQFLGFYVDIIAATPLHAPACGLKSLDTIQVAKTMEILRPPTVQDDRFIFTIRWSFKKADVERLSLSNEIWFPSKPITRSVTIAKFENKDGTVVLVPQESKAFWS